MNRQTLFIIAAVVLGVALILFVVNTDSTPQSGDVVGTIGAADAEGPIPGVEQAERYRAQQLDDGAVTLENPEIQELLQDDEILRLVQSPEFQHAMRQPGVALALRDEALQSALLSREFRDAMVQFRGDRAQAAPLSRQEVAARVSREFGDTPLSHALNANRELAVALLQHQALARAIARNSELSEALARSEALQSVFANRDAMLSMAALSRVDRAEAVGLQRFFERSAALELVARDDLREAFFQHARSMPTMHQ